MMQQHSIPPVLRPPKLGGWRSLLLTFLVLLGVGIAPPALFFGLLLRRAAAHSWDSQDRWSGIWAFALLFSLGYGLLAWFGHTYALFWEAFSYDIVHGMFSYAFTTLLEVWGYHLLLAPVFALALEGVEPLTRTLPTRPHKHERAPQVDSPSTALVVRDTPQTALIPAAPQVIIRTVSAVGADAIIGQALGGDLWQWVQAGWFTLPERVLNEGGLVLGRPGTGKSKTLQRLAYVARYVYGRKVFVVDGKGDWDAAAEFDLIMRAAGCQHVGVFPCDRHHGWYGSRQEVVSRLMNCQVFSDSYYRGHTLNILNDAFYLPGYEMPKNSQEFLDRIDPPTIKALYKGTQRYTYYQSLRPDVLWGAHGRYNALFNSIGNGLDGEHGFGHWDSCYYLLDQKRLQRESATFAKLLFDDFELYVAMRNASVPASRHRQLMLIIDDYSAFSDLVPIRDLMERLRGAGVSVIASAQGMESLGATEKEAKRLLESAGTVALHACSLPKNLVEVAGTRRMPDVVYHLRDDDANQPGVFARPGQTSLHTREVSSIDPNDVQQLGRGESFWASGGLHQRVQVEMVPIAEALIEERKQQLLIQAERERERYEAAQAERLARPAPKTEKRPRQSKPSKSPKAAPAVAPRQQAQPAALPVEPQPAPQSQRQTPGAQGAERTDKQTPIPTSLEELL